MGRDGDQKNMGPPGCGAQERRGQTLTVKKGEKTVAQVVPIVYVGTFNSFGAMVYIRPLLGIHYATRHSKQMVQKNSIFP